MAVIDFTVRHTSEPSMNSEEFRIQLLDYLRAHSHVLMTFDGNWTIKGFVDVNKNIYTVSADTKVVSKLLELMILPILGQFASIHTLTMIPSREQNHYPDFTFISSTGMKFAVDIKSTYRKDDHTVSGFTLGAFTGYFRNRQSHKNITYPYSSYAYHFIIGIIYTQKDNTDIDYIYTIDDIMRIKSVITDIEFVVQEKYRIATDRPGSGNTKNIGSCNKIAELRDGTGPFASLGPELFDDYWMHYLTNEMAERAEFVTKPYNNLREYLRYRNIKDK